MLAMVDAGQAFRADDSDVFMLISVEEWDHPSGCVFPDEIHVMMFDNNMDDWRVWCQPSKQPLEKHNWYAMRVGDGWEKVHRAKVYF